MSLQAGICYLDGREIDHNQTAAILKFVESDLTHAPAAHQQSGVLLVHACSRNQWQVQPFLTTNGAVTFDGRLDNRQDLRERLNDAAAGSTDPQLAFAAYERWGIEGLVHLIGDWSLVIWDAARRRVVLASDFAGVRPLYYRADGPRVIWSTRLQPLLDFAGTREIDDEYVAAFLAFSGCPSRTPYRGVYSVPAGAAAVIDPHGLRIERFWRIPAAKAIHYAHPSEYEEQLRHLFREAVHSRIPQGACCLSELSGGLDSSSVVAMSAELIRSGEAKPERFQTVTLEHEGSRDVPFYAEIESTCGFESIHLHASDYPWVTETETGESLPVFWHSLTKKMAALASAVHATTFLTGKLGDDVMGNWWDDSDQVAGLLRDGRVGAALHQAFHWSQWLHVPIALVLWRAFLAALPPALHLFPADRFASARRTSIDRQDSILPRFRAKTGLGEPRHFFSPEWRYARPERRKHCFNLTRALETRRLQVPESLEHLDYVHPFAHRPLVEFMLSVPAEIVCGPGEPRRLMRKAFRELWPARLRQRRSKDDFGALFLSALRSLAAKLLNEKRRLEVVERGYLDEESLKERLQRLTMSLNCNESQLRQVILLEFWLRKQSARC